MGREGSEKTVQGVKSAVEHDRRCETRTLGTLTGPRRLKTRGTLIAPLRSFCMEKGVHAFPSESFVPTENIKNKIKKMKKLFRKKGAQLSSAFT